MTPPGLSQRSRATMTGTSIPSSIPNPPSHSETITSTRSCWLVMRRWTHTAQTDAGSLTKGKEFPMGFRRRVRRRALALEATGRQVQLPGVTVADFREGNIRSFRIYFDDLSLIEQIVGA
jgi:hypothetical protein